MPAETEFTNPIAHSSDNASYAKQVFYQFFNYFENIKPALQNLKIKDELIALYDKANEEIRANLNKEAEQNNIESLQNFQESFLGKLKDIETTSLKSRIADYILIRNPSQEEEARKNKQQELKEIFLTTLTIIAKLATVEENFYTAKEKVKEEHKYFAESIQNSVAAEEKLIKDFKEKVKELDDKHYSESILQQYHDAHTKVEQQYTALLNTEINSHYTVGELAKLAKASFTSFQEQEESKKAILNLYQPIKDRKLDTLTPQDLDFFSTTFSSYLKSKRQITKAFLDQHEQFQNKTKRKQLNSSKKEFEQIKKSLSESSIMQTIQEFADIDKKERTEIKANLEVNLRDNIDDLKEIATKVDQYCAEMEDFFSKYDFFKDDIGNLRGHTSTSKGVNDYNFSVHFILEEFQKNVRAYCTHLNTKLLLPVINTIIDKSNEYLQSLPQNQDILTNLILNSSENLSKMDETFAELSKLLIPTKELSKTMDTFFLSALEEKTIQEDLAFLKNQFVTGVTGDLEIVKEDFQTYSNEYCLEHEPNEEKEGAAWLAWRRKISADIVEDFKDLEEQSFSELTHLKNKLKNINEEIISRKNQFKSEQDQIYLTWKALNNHPLKDLPLMPVQDLVDYLKTETKQYMRFLEERSKDPLSSEKMPVLKKISLLLKRTNSLNALHAEGGLSSREMATLSQVYKGYPVFNFFKHLFSVLTCRIFDKKEIPAQKIFLRKLLTIVPELSIAALEKREQGKPSTEVKTPSMGAGGPLSTVYMKANLKGQQPQENTSTEKTDLTETGGLKKNPAPLFLPSPGQTIPSEFSKEKPVEFSHSSPTQSLGSS